MWLAYNVDTDVTKYTDGSTVPHTDYQSAPSGTFAAVYIDKGNAWKWFTSTGSDMDAYAVCYKYSELVFHLFWLKVFCLGFVISSKTFTVETVIRKCRVLLTS